VTAAPRGTCVAANGIELCYDEFGDPSDPPMLLIMGLATQMIVWDDEFCAMLAARGFRVIRFDNRDVGRSTHFVRARTPSVLEMMLVQATRLRFRVPYLLADMAADALGLLDALGIASAHIVGISMGGAIAQEIAIHNPERIRTLTSIMSTTGDPKLPRPARRAMLALGKRMPRERAAWIREYVETWRVLAGDGGLGFDSERMARHGAETLDRGVNPAGASRQLFAMLASGDRTRALHGVHVPTLVIHGSHDPLIPVAAGYATAKAVPGARLLVIDGMGHTLPEEVWPRLVDAIAEHAGAPRRTAPAG
jgi:pimeloyl-ACP methyl ester carboxylesterase